MSRVVIVEDSRVVTVLVDASVDDVVLTGDQEVTAIDDSVVVGPGWIVTEDGFAPPAPPALSKADLTAYAADARWRKEVGGIVVGSVPVATDDRSKQMIIGARIAADADPNWSTSWVGANGAIYPVDASAITDISNAVQDHVNDCFESFAVIKAEIESGDITTTSEIDAAFAA